MKISIVLELYLCAQCVGVLTSLYPFLRGQLKYREEVEIAMILLCHLNDFGSLCLCSMVAIRLLALLSAHQGSITGGR
jgi:hypothetical protein